MDGCLQNVNAGEWVCTLKELSERFRTYYRRRREAIESLASFSILWEYTAKDSMDVWNSFPQ